MIRLNRSGCSTSGKCPPSANIDPIDLLRRKGRPVHDHHANRIQSGRLIMPRGASPKREHEYQELKTEFKKEGRYPGREEEVASRIVNKQRAQRGETKKSSKKEKAKS
jgi:hypothetical protein